jgi:hypothetical protein
MKSKILLGAVGAVFLASQAQAGCVGGAVIGGVAGHFAHHHALAGAAAGCVIGHEFAVHKKRERERRRWEREHHRY